LALRDRYFYRTDSSLLVLRDRYFCHTVNLVYIVSPHNSSFISSADQLFLVVLTFSFRLRTTFARFTVIPFTSSGQFTLGFARHIFLSHFSSLVRTIHSWIFFHHFHSTQDLLFLLTLHLDASHTSAGFHFILYILLKQCPLLLQP
jgi:hypothetical protein